MAPSTLGRPFEPPCTRNGSTEPVHRRRFPGRLRPTVDGPQIARALALNLITMVLSLSVHEYAHAFVADRLGDDTPRRQGRLTLSPLEHYDVFGTFLIPIVATILGGFAMIGWARPVETTPSKYDRRVSMRRGTMLVALAGPLANLLLAVLAIVALSVLDGVEPAMATRRDSVGAFVNFLQAMFLVNIGLLVFNLIPLPPLDGARLLPRSLDGFQQTVAPFSFFIILMILNVPILRNLFVGPVVIVGAFLQVAFGVTVRLGA
jgi:Zn-dependent protease